ncbi:MAG: hypothetical protein CBB67_000900 [Alteromonadaceae bacterium TMED7]|nr:MAG: hypothetical protein CBB67_000900 [Alteromonadaceae bacterium TMED7]|tara:strand:+ start:3043 stop:4296 length:1254 start_codon:yes stop_codon:yes gene_type:complete
MMSTQQSDIESALWSIVSLYRSSGKPPIGASNRIEVELNATESLIEAIEECRLLNSSLGRFEDLLVDDSEIDNNEKIRVGQRVQFCWALSTGGDLHFFKSYGHLLSNRKTLLKGDLPDIYYIADVDLMVEPSLSEPKSDRLRSICDLIKLLSEIAHYHDEKSQADTYQLVFVVNDSSKSGYHPVVLETRFDESDLNGNALNLGALSDIVSAEQNAESHAQEKASMFRLCLAETIEGISNENNVFKYILNNWDELLRKYKQSFDIYISGFSFSKVRSELAEAEVEIANSLSKVLSDVTGKLFSIPISFAALLTMNKLDSVGESVLFVMGTLLVSLIISGLVRSQLLLKSNIDASRAMVFNQFEQKREDYPPDLKNCLDEAQNTIGKQSALLGFTLHGARVLGWLVSICALYIFWMRFS